MESSFIFIKVTRGNAPCTTLGVSAPSLASSLKQITVGAQLATWFEHKSGNGNKIVPKTVGSHNRIVSRWRWLNAYIHDMTH